MGEDGILVYLLEKMGDGFQNEIENKTEELLRKTLDFIIYGESQDNSFDLDDRTFRKIIVKFEINQHIEFQRAYYLGLWKAIFDMKRRALKKREDTIIWKDSYNSYKYLKPFIIYLYQENIMSYEEIKKSLNIEKSSLSNFLKRIEKYNFYSVQCFGKKKLYSITKEGKKFYNNICNSENRKLQDEDFSDFIIRLIRFLYTELEEEKPSADRILSNISKTNEINPYLTKMKSVRRELESFLTNIKSHIYKSNNYINDERYIHITNNDESKYSDIKTYYFQYKIEPNYDKTLETTKRLSNIGNNRSKVYLNHIIDYQRGE